jgi:hypothetical protein
MLAGGLGQLLRDCGRGGRTFRKRGAQRLDGGAQFDQPGIERIETLLQCVAMLSELEAFGGKFFKTNDVVLLLVVKCA